jgi:hypothetical protein
VGRSIELDAGGAGLTAGRIDGLDLRKSLQELCAIARTSGRTIAVEARPSKLKIRRGVCCE